MESTPLCWINREHKDKRFYLLSRRWIVEHFAAYAKGLTQVLIREMQENEVALVCDKARRRISDNLHRFTYGGQFKERRFDEVCTHGWLGDLMGGFEPQSRNEFYRTLGQDSPSKEVQELCDILQAATRGEEGQLYKKLIESSLDHADVSEPREAFLFLFEFLGKDFLVGVTPEDLPAGLNGDIAELDVNKIDPVLLKTDLKEKGHLGIYYKRVSSVRVCMRSHVIGSDVRIRVAEFIEDVTEQHLFNYENGFLKNVLRARTPFHERRLLQMAGIPNRQALGDVFHNRMSVGLRPMEPHQDRRSYQSRDEVVFEEIKQHVAFKSNLQCISSLDDLQALLVDTATERPNNLIGKMAVLQKISSFNAPLTNTLAKVVEGFANELDEQGHTLAARLCRTVLGFSGRPIGQDDSKKQCKEWIAAFWEEIADCFPDGGSDWCRFREFAYERASRQTHDSSEKSVYTLFVIASVFDRQITRFYEPLGKYTMPYDAIVWAINAVHRLQMMSVLLPMCCGDWACWHTSDNIFARRLRWSHRVAASVNPSGKVRGGSSGHVPVPNTDRYFYCYGNGCRHAPSEAALQAVAKMLNFEESTVNWILRKMGWWFNVLLDEELHHHFRCKCGTMMAPLIKDRGLNLFSCPRAGSGGHDTNVYLTWCAHSYCNHVIDSRDDLKTCDKGGYICSECGSCCPDHLHKREYNEKELADQIWVPACCKCSRELNVAWEAIRQGVIPEKGAGFKCPACNAPNTVYPSRKAFWKATSGDTKEATALQWSMMDKSFQYNTRPSRQ